VTINEFSKQIGVSSTTVSRAIHGRGRVSPVTRRKVLEGMKELGYTPNLNAQRLSHGRTNMVALDFGDWHDYLSDMYFVEITRGVEEVLETRGYGVLLCGPGAVLNRWVKTRAVDGVILMGNPADKSVSQDIAKTGTPCVVIGNHPVEGIQGVGSVVVGVRSGARQVAQLLVERGHRRIGYISSEYLDVVFYEFRDELERLRVTLSEDCIVRAVHTPDDGSRALCELLALREPPTAVFTRTDGFAFGALSAAHRLGLRIPEDLSIVGHDDVSFAKLTQPPLTTVRVDCVKLAGFAADTLFSLLDEPNSLTEPQVVPTELVVRDSVSAPRAWALGYREPVRLAAHRDADSQVTA
jgi:LacI family repressor for deo operon, udp, cdd, tsx, nupC, and nupG